MAKTRVNLITLSLPDDEEIVAEYRRLLSLFESLPEKQLGIARKLISRAAFLTVTLDRLESDIVRDGYEQEYRNGEFQHGKKRSIAADLHVAYSKNLFTVMKQLADLLSSQAAPPEELDEFERF